MFSSDFLALKRSEREESDGLEAGLYKEHWDTNLKTGRLFHLESIHRALPRVELS